MKSWIKLYIEILDDPKMGKMPDWLFRRAIELFLLAGRNGNDGALPPVGDMAWILRLDETKLSEALHCLEEVGVVHEAEPGIWYVTHFEERQAAESVAERVANHRRNVTKRYNNVTSSVTKRYNNVTREEEDKESDQESSTTTSSGTGAGDEQAGPDPAEKPAETVQASEVEPEISEQGCALAQETEIAMPARAGPNAAGEVFRLYEQNFGALTPLMAEEVGDLLDHYPRDWIEMAFREAVRHEKRSLSYARAILDRWKREGFGSDTRKSGGRNGRNHDGREAGAESRRYYDPQPTEADLRAAERIAERQRRKREQARDM